MTPIIFLLFNQIRLNIYANKEGPKKTKQMIEENKTVIETRREIRILTFSLMLVKVATS